MDNWTGDNDSKSIRVLIQIGGRIQGFHHQNRRFDLEKTRKFDHEKITERIKRIRIRRRIQLGRR